MLGLSDLLKYFIIDFAYIYFEKVVFWTQFNFDLTKSFSRMQGQYSNII